jgi:deoxyhypusine synthase
MTESMQGDFSVMMPFLVKALLDNRNRYQQIAEKIGVEKFSARHPEAVGYLRPKGGFRLYDKREDLCAKLTEDVRNNRDWLMDSIVYPFRNRS